MKFMAVYLRIFNILWLLLVPVCFSLGQKDSGCPGWSGDLIVPNEDFYNASKWTANASAGSSCSVVVSDTSVDLHWKLSAGNGQWVQCFLILPEPVSLSQYDLFGFDLHGSACDAGYPCHKEQVVEVKFEDGSLQASNSRMGEEGILCVNRWINKLFFHNTTIFFLSRWDLTGIISRYCHSV